MTASVAQRLGEYVASLRTRDLSQEVLTKAAVCLVDAIGLGVAARSEPATRAYLRTVQTVPDQAVPDQASAGTSGLGPARPSLSSSYPTSSPSTCTATSR